MTSHHPIPATTNWPSTTLRPMALVKCLLTLFATTSIAAAQPCPGGGGNCCQPEGNGSPGCEDPQCCNQICAVDPFCCEAFWDPPCAELAQQTCMVCGAPPMLVDVYATIGGGGPGEAAVRSGVWDFDNLSEVQRNEAGNCDSTIFHRFGEQLEQFQWSPSPLSSVDPRVEMDTPDGSKASSFDVGGGVLVFDDPGKGFAPGHVSEMYSPEIDVATMGLVPGTSMQISFAAVSDQASTALDFVAAVRIFENGAWTGWEEVESPVINGAAQYRFGFNQLISVNTQKIQKKVGVKNNGPNPVNGDGPKVDKVKGEAKKPQPASTWKYVPDISQSDPDVVNDTQAICQATAFANCLSWWANNGYPELAGDGDTQEEKNEDLQKKLKEKCHGKKSDENDNGSGDGGVTGYLRDKGVYRGQPPAQENRPQLEHKRRSGTSATWAWLKEQFEAGADVLLRLQWYNDEGEKVGGDGAAHYVTVAKVTESGDDKCVHVANPWGEAHHEVDEDNRDDAYDKLDITVNENGTIRADNNDLEQNASGIEGATYLCVESINVIRKVATGGAPYVPQRLERLPNQEAGPGEVVTYAYQLSNFEATPMHYIALIVEVPYHNVQAPPGWDWEPLPALYPGATDCGSRIGPTGILWSTDTDPLEPGAVLPGFEFQADAIYPEDPERLIWYVDTEGLAGEFGFVAGPAPLPPCSADLDGDGVVGVTDLVAVILNWGVCGNCAEDLNGDGLVDVLDLVELVLAWGPC